MDVTYVHIPGAGLAVSVTVIDYDSRSLFALGLTWSYIARPFASYVRDDYAHVRIQHRMPTQLGLLQRFQQTFKDEEVYWRLYDSREHARPCFAEFRTRYHHVRPHWALGPRGRR